MKEKKTIGSAENAAASADAGLIENKVERFKIAEIRGLYKKYLKNADYAVKDLSLNLYEGEIVGLLGANGAGKSTTLKCLTGMLLPTAGEIFVCGRSMTREPINAKRNFSFVSDNHSVFVKMTGMQYLSFMADIYGVPTAERSETYKELEECFNIGDKIDRLIGSYSHGTKQKICMMGSLMHKPKLWILDEPMLGLDPPTTKAVTEFMKSYAEKGNTVLFSSHNLDVVGRICNRALLIEKGALKAEVDLSDGMSGSELSDALSGYLSRGGESVD